MGRLGQPQTSGSSSEQSSAEIDFSALFGISQNNNLESSGQTSETKKDPEKKIENILLGYLVVHVCHTVPGAVTLR